MPIALGIEQVASEPEEEIQEIEEADQIHIDN